MAVGSIKEKTHKALPGWEALQILALLGRFAEASVQRFGERGLGLAATRAAEGLKAMDGSEVGCCLELLLDAAHEFAQIGATGGCRKIIEVLQQLSVQGTLQAQALCNEPLWKHEHRKRIIMM